MMCGSGYKAKQDRTKKRKRTESSRLKILTPKQMLQRLPIALAQVKAGNNSEFIKWDQANCLFFVSIKRNH